MIQYSPFYTVLLLLLLLFQSALLHSMTEHLSITALIIRSGERILEEDYFFDLLDRGHYILLPVSALSSILNLQILYQQEEDWLKIQSTETGKQVQVDMKNGIYFTHPDWSHQPPILAQGDFFVTPLLLEYLSPVEVDWNPRRQEVTLILLTEPKEEKEERIPPPEKEKEKEEREPTITGSPLSLGSVQYRITFEERISTKGTSHSSWKKNMALHGRAGEWALSGVLETGLFLQIDSPFEDDSLPTAEGYTSLEFPFIRALYNKDNHFISIGDSTVNLINTLGRRDLRGLYYQYPSQRPNHLLAFTSIQGEAQEGHQVSLYLNESLYQELTVGEDSRYQFLQVPLQIKRENQIRVVIESQGEIIEEMEETLVASPRILEEGRKGFQLLLGNYRRPADSRWEGQLAGSSINLGLSHDKSLIWEVVGQRPYHFHQLGPLEASSSLGLALQTSQRTVVTLDWMYGQLHAYEENAYRSSLLYGRKRGYWELEYQTFPESLKLLFPGRVGEGWLMESRWSLAPNWGLAVVGESLRIPHTAPPSKGEGVELTISNRDGFSRETNLGGAYRERTFYVEEDAQQLQLVTETGLLFSDYRDSRDMSTKLDLSLFTSQRDYKEEFSLRVDTVDVKTSMVRRLTSWLFASAKLQTWGSFVEDHLTEVEAEKEILLQWSPLQRTSLSLSGHVRGGMEGRDPFTQEESQIKLSLRHRSSRFTSFSLEGVERRFQPEEEAYQRYQLGVNHFFSSEQGSISMNIGYHAPVGIRTTPQWTAQLEATRIVNSNLDLHLRLSRSYTSIFDDEYEDVITLSFGQRFGFSKDETVQQRVAKEEQHVAFIGGRVYLDENANGVYDEGEPFLFDIPIALNGRRSTTNEEGLFLFEYVWPGVYEIGFDMQNLAAEYSIVTPEKIVQIRENENLFLYFGVTLNGAISGTVFLNQKADGTRGVQDRPLQWIGLTVVENGKTVYTREDGSFYLENIPLGEYTLKILEDSLPPGMRIWGEKEIPFQITSETLLLEAIEIPIIYHSL